MQDIPRCAWCQDGGPMQAYHDEEWGVPLDDDRRHFEYLMMEVMQCGLSWRLMLERREAFRQAFDGFDYERIAAYGPGEEARILQAPGMIRSPGKIRAVIQNARVYEGILQEYGSFAAYLAAFAGDRPRRYPAARRSASSWPRSSPAGGPDARFISWTSRPPACTPPTWSG